MSEGGELVEAVEMPDRRGLAARWTGSTMNWAARGFPLLGKGVKYLNFMNILYIIKSLYFLPRSG